MSAVETSHKEALLYEQLITQNSPERVVLGTRGGTYDRDYGGWDPASW